MLLPRLVSARSIDYFVGILLNPDNMLPQFLCILDARLGLEEGFFLRV